MAGMRCDIQTGGLPLRLPNRGMLRNNACRHNLLVPTLDLPQRHAYYEIFALVRQVVDNRLPAELVDMVFEQTLIAETIPKDPRVVVMAIHMEEKEKEEHQ
jgi:hypothetical protein